MNIYNSDKYLINLINISTFQSDKEIVLGEWKVEDYDTYIIQLSWFNSTDAGLGSINIEVSELNSNPPFPIEIIFIILLITIPASIFTIIMIKKEKKIRPSKVL